LKTVSTFLGTCALASICCCILLEYHSPFPILGATVDLLFAAAGMSLISSVLFLASLIPHGNRSRLNLILGALLLLVGGGFLVYEADLFGGPRKPDLFKLNPGDSESSENPSREREVNPVLPDRH
jgi:hypothetical protein